jgi:phage terminase small subunit
MPLTAKEEKFCQEYVKRLDKTKAAIAAAYSRKSAKQIGYENFTKPYIKQRITEIQAEIKEKLGIDDHSVLTELSALAFWNVKDFLKADNSLKDLSKMQKVKLKPIAGIKVTERIIKTGETSTEKIITTELKFADKRGALGDLGRHLGIFEEDNKQTAIKIKVSRK